MKEYLKLKYLLKYWSIQISNEGIYDTKMKILASLSSCGSKPIPKSFFCGTQKKIFWRMFQLLKHWDILQNIFFCVSQKNIRSLSICTKRLCTVCILDLGLTAENCSRRLLFIAVHTQSWPLWVVFVCMCLRESTHHPFGVGNEVWRLVKEKQSPSPSFITNMHLESCRALW